MSNATMTAVSRADERQIRKEQGRRLQLIREKAGYRDASDAARAIGVPIPTYQAHENGSRSIIKNAMLYADFFGVDINYLLRAEETAPHLAPVRGTIAPGLWTDEQTFVQPAYEPVPASPSYREKEQVAFMLQGGQPNQTSYVICAPYWSMRGGLKHGDRVIAESRRDHLVKREIYRVRLTPQGAYLDPILADGQSRQLAANLQPGTGHDPKITHLVIADYSVDRGV